MKLIYQINLAFGIVLILILSVTAAVTHYILLDYFIGVQKEELKKMGIEITNSLNEKDIESIQIKDFLTSPIPSKDIEMILIDDNGDIISSSVPKENIDFFVDPKDIKDATDIEAVQNGSDDQFITEVNKTSQGTITLLTPISKVKEIEQALFKQLLIIFCLGGVFMFICSLFITKKLIQPLMKLCEELKKVKERKFSDVKLIKVRGEIGSVAQSVYDMAGELERYHHVQKQFFQNSSHELKTPLMSISGYAEGIRDGVFEGESVQKGLDIIISESDRLTKIVTEMTLLAKLDSEEGIFKNTTFPLQDLLIETVERMNPILMKKNLTLHILCADELFMIYADRNKLLQALINVVSNATRYAKQEIFVETRLNQERIEIMIRDDGPGIPEELLLYLFHRFVKGKDGESGLGLAISRAIVERCGGTITADNHQEGGAVITIGFPVVKNDR